MTLKIRQNNNVNPTNSNLWGSCKFYIVVGHMDIESYTFEDYIKDFELDYLGFDGVPDEPVSGVTPEKISENKPAPEPSDSGEDIHLL